MVKLPTQILLAHIDHLVDSSADASADAGLARLGVVLSGERDGFEGDTHAASMPVAAGRVTHLAERLQEEDARARGIRDAGALWRWGTTHWHVGHAQAIDFARVRPGS